MFTKKAVVEGWQLVSLVVLIVVAVVSYGAFVFDRALKMSGKTPLGSGDIGISAPRDIRS